MTSFGFILESVEKLKYLRLIVIKDNKMEEEIKPKIGNGKKYISRSERSLKIEIYQHFDPLILSVTQHSINFHNVRVSIVNWEKNLNRTPLYQKCLR